MLTLERAATQSAVSLAMVKSIADDWKIRQLELAAILGVKDRTLRDWESIASLELKAPVLERMGHVMAIYDNTHRLFGDHPYADQWVSTENEAFAGQKPLALMTKGFTGVIQVRNYLDKALAY